MTKMTKEDWKYLFSTQPTEYTKDSGGFSRNFKERQFLSNVLHNIGLMIPQPQDNDVVSAWNDMSSHINSNLIKKNLTPHIDKLCELLEGKHTRSEALAQIVSKAQRCDEKMYSSSHLASFVGYLNIQDPKIEGAFNDLMNQDRKNLIYENLTWVDINNGKKQQKKDKNIELPKWIKENKNFFLALEELGIGKAKKFIKFLNNVKAEDVQTFFANNKETLDKNILFQEYLKTDNQLQELYFKYRETTSTLDDTDLSFARSITVKETATIATVKLFENLPPNTEVRHRQNFKQMFMTYSQNEITHLSFQEGKESMNINLSYNTETSKINDEEFQKRIKDDMTHISQIFNDFKNIVATSPKIEEWIYRFSFDHNEIKDYIEVAKADKKMNAIIQNAIQQDNDEPIRSNSFKL